MCNSHSRRAFVIGGLSSVMIGNVADAQYRGGMACGAAMGGVPPSGFTSTTGNSRLDQAIISEVRNIGRVIPTNPTFKFYDDYQSPNAMAYSPAGQLPIQTLPGTWGLVIIGLTLLRAELAPDMGGIALAGIIAHECGHIWQFQFPALDRDLKGETARNKELHADYMAGFYFGRDGRRNVDDIEVFSRSLFNKGSYNYNNSDFHGTPETRVTAMKIGYRQAQTGRDVGDVSYDGIQIVRNIH
jgi:hypothetical protein